MIHQNSIEAYASLNLPERDLEVIKAFLVLGNATDRAVCMLHGQADLNYARPTITRLTELGILCEVAGVKCSVTNKTVRVSTLTNTEGMKPVTQEQVPYESATTKIANLIPMQQVDPDCRATLQDEPGAGGAFHKYLLSVLGPVIDVTHKDGSVSATRTPIAQFPLSFQKGGKQEAGVNGISQEVLLEVVRHRLACFQSGPFPSKENESALNHVIAALEMLRRRTAKRARRGVEGKSVA